MVAGPPQHHSGQAVRGHVTDPPERVLAPPAERLARLSKLALYQETTADDGFPADIRVLTRTSERTKKRQR